jgi:hypothetical protein
MPKKLKSCTQCAKLAAERDQLISYRQLYEQANEQRIKLKERLEAA